VALPLTKLVLATEAALFAAPAFKAERAATEERNSVVDMIMDVNLRCVDTTSIELFSMTQFVSCLEKENIRIQWMLESGELGFLTSLAEAK
jgi:hypothetical protein